MADPIAALPEGAVCAVHEGVPATFVCRRCGSYGCRSCSSDGGYCASCGAPPIEWERWRELGLLPAFVATTRELLLQPTGFFRKSTRSEAGAGPAFAYGAAAYTVGLVFYMLEAAILSALMALVGAGSNSQFGELGVMLGTFVCVIPMALVMGPISAAIAIVWSSAWSHLTLRIFGARTKPFEQTLRAVSYSIAPSVAMAIPCVGWFGWFFWQVVLEVIALRETHEVGTGLALVAALGHRILVLVLVVAFYAALVGLFVASAPFGQ